MWLYICGNNLWENSYCSNVRHYIAGLVFHYLDYWYHEVLLIEPDWTIVDKHNLRYKVKKIDKFLGCCAAVVLGR